MSADMIDSVLLRRSKYEALMAAAKMAKAFLMNAKIDLETGCPKRTAIKTIEGGIAHIDGALRAAGIDLEGKP